MSMRRAATRTTEMNSSWRWTDLRRPSVLIASLAALAVSVPVSFVASCNLHELGHVLVAVPLGWEVERVNLCLPGGGSVQYAHVGTWAGNAQGYAGGFIAALGLGLVYFFAFVRSRRPLRSPVWWALGTGPLLLIGPQVVLGFIEGSAGPGEDYGARIEASLHVYVPLLVGFMVVGAAVHTWIWRAVWHRVRE